MSNNKEKVEIINIVDYGLFVKDKNGEIGLVHISEASHKFIKDLNDEFKIGDVLEVIKIPTTDGKSAYSIKKLIKKKPYREKIKETKTGDKTLKKKLPEMINQFFFKKK